MPSEQRLFWQDERKEVGGCEEKGAQAQRAGGVRFLRKGRSIAGRSIAL